MKKVTITKEQKKKCMVVSIILGTVAVAAVIARIMMKINQFKKNTDHAFMFTAKEVDFEGEVFEDACYASAYSAVEIDLSKAEASKNPMNLCIKSKYSAVEVTVPKGWNVKAEGVNEHSGVDIQTEFDPDNIEAPLLFINYIMKKSAFEVRREKVVEPKENVLIEEELVFGNE